MPAIDKISSDTWRLSEATALHEQIVWSGLFLAYISFKVDQGKITEWPHKANCHHVVSWRDWSDFYTVPPVKFFDRTHEVHVSD